MSDDISQIARSRQGQLDSIRKLIEEKESALPGRKKEIESEIAARAEDIRRLEARLIQLQGEGN